MTKGYLVLETGETFEGIWIGAEKEVEGEVVFNTSMTGYTDMITDPSSTGQILTFTSPTIGNYGVNTTGKQEKIATTGVILNDLCTHPSHYQASSTFSEILKQSNIPGLMDVDTRALVKVLRKTHTIKGKITKEKSTLPHVWEEQETKKLINRVSVQTYETFGNGKNHLVLLDFGYKKSIVNKFIEMNCRLTIVPYTTSLSIIQSLQPDGIVISNGPGNPLELASVFPTIKALTKIYPTIGIGLGHQLIALSYGAKIKKLAYGHRGVNYPVKNILTGKVHITSQNHGYVVEEDSIDYSHFHILFKNVNDQTIEGIKHVDLPVLSVEFYPEGNSDTEYIFHDFMQLVITSGGRMYVKA